MANRAARDRASPGTRSRARELANSILDMIRDGQLQVGHRLREQHLAKAFRVSRTPVRGALKLLADMGVLEMRPNLGYFLAKPFYSLDAVRVEVPPTPEQRLYRQLVRDRLEGRLLGPLVQSEIESAYGAERAVVLEALRRLASDGLVTRKGLRGWEFLPTLSMDQGLVASYELRATLEPAALLLPGFRADRTLLSRVRHRHDYILTHPKIDDLSPVLLFETDSSFHEALAECSGNPYFVQIVGQQNRLRRLLEFSTYGKRGRIREWCREHLAILDAVQDGELSLASQLMREHLDRGAAEARTSHRPSAATTLARGSRIPEEVGY